MLVQHNVRTPEGRSQLLDQLRPYYAKIPLQSLKDQILAEVETRLGQQIDDRLLRLMGEEKNRPANTRPHLPEQHWTPTRLAINLLLQKPALAASVGTPHELAESNIPGVSATQGARSHPR